MVTLGNPVFWIVNILLVIMFVFSLAFGWEHGGRRMGLDVLKTILHFALTIVLTVFLTKRYSWFEYDSFYAYLTSLNGAGRELSPLEVDKFRFFRSGIVWFWICLIVLELIMGTAIRIYRKKHKKEKKPLSKADHLSGEIAGGLLLMLWVILLAPVAVSLDKTDVFTNASDLIDRTVVTVPVNYIAKPVTKLLMPDSKLSRVWDEGFSEMAESLYDMDEWVEENKNDTAVIADLTGFIYSIRQSLNDLK